MTEATNTDLSTATVTEYVEGKSSGYTIRAQLLDPEADPDLEKQGIRSTKVLFTVFAGAQVFSHYDRFKLIQKMPGQNKWLHDHLKRLADQVRNDPADTPHEEVENYIIGVEDTFRVPAHEVDGPEEAERVAAEQFGHKNWLVTNPAVVGVEREPGEE